MMTWVSFTVLVCHVSLVSALPLVSVTPSGCEHNGNMYGVGEPIPELAGRDGDHCFGSTCTDMGGGIYMILNWQSDPCPLQTTPASM
jgi:hypothetical protein